LVPARDNDKWLADEELAKLCRDEWGDVPADLSRHLFCAGSPLNGVFALVE